MTKPETPHEYLKRIGRKGAKAAKKILTTEDRRQFGTMGGRLPGGQYRTKKKK